MPAVKLTDRQIQILSTMHEQSKPEYGAVDEGVEKELHDLASLGLLKARKQAYLNINAKVNDAHKAVHVRNFYRLTTAARRLLTRRKDHGESK